MKKQIREKIKEATYFKNRSLNCIDRDGSIRPGDGSFDEKTLSEKDLRNVIYLTKSNSPVGAAVSLSKSPKDMQRWSYAPTARNEDLGLDVASYQAKKGPLGIWGLYENIGGHVTCYGNIGSLYGISLSKENASRRVGEKANKLSKLVSEETGLQIISN